MVRHTEHSLKEMRAQAGGAPAANTPSAALERRIEELTIELAVTQAVVSSLLKGTPPSQDELVVFERFAEASAELVAGLSEAPKKKSK